ncbi:MAG: rod shape-determining protein MreD [Aquificota bacterium]|nr:rod shape-determining protein MreD [Aquificota bacterium]
MRYLILILSLVFVQTSLLQVFFSPGFVAPDLLLIALLSRAYLTGRDAVLWAFFGGALLDIMTDTLGLNLALETLSVYLFVLMNEKIFFKTWLTYLTGAGFSLLLKKVLSLVVMSVKFSFSFSFPSVLLALLLEVLIASAVYFAYLKKKE